MKSGEVRSKYVRKYPEFIFKCNDTYGITCSAKGRSKSRINKAQKEFDTREKLLKKLGFTYFGKELTESSTMWIWGIPRKKYNQAIEDKLIDIGL